MKLFDNLPRCQYYDQFYYCDQGMVSEFAQGPETT